MKCQYHIYTTPACMHCLIQQAIKAKEKKKRKECKGKKENIMKHSKYNEMISLSINK